MSAPNLESISRNVLKKIEDDFDESNQSEIVEVLSLYSGNETERVQADILRLAKGDAKEVENLVGSAMRDYRDVIFWAEYPEESRIDPTEKRQKIRELFKWLKVDVPEDLKD
jgi:predicted metalloprotease